MEEHEKWQNMMRSCRKASNILGIEYKEPMYLDWKAGREYYNSLWERVKRNKTGGSR